MIIRFALIDAYVESLDLGAPGICSGVDPKADWDGRHIIRAVLLEAFHLRLSQRGAVEPSAGAREPLAMSR